MVLNELQIIQDNRLEGESINAARERLQKEGKLTPSEQKIANVEEKSVVDENFPELENNFTQEDMSIPRYKIIQPTSRIENIDAGKFYNSLTGETYEKLEDIVFLLRNSGRVLFPEGNFNGERVCWSYSGTHPAADDIVAMTGNQPKSEICVSKTGNQKVHHCPFASWRNEKGEPYNKGKFPPLCKETLSFLGLDKNLLPFYINFHGMALLSAKNFLKTIFIKKQQALMNNKKLGLYDFRFTITLELKIGERGKYYIPSFVNTKEIIEVEQKRVIRVCCRDFSALKNQVAVV
jgi:hypothetical protein